MKKMKWLLICSLLLIAIFGVLFEFILKKQASSSPDPSQLKLNKTRYMEARDRDVEKEKYFDFIFQLTQACYKGEKDACANLEQSQKNSRDKKYWATVNIRLNALLFSGVSSIQTWEDRRDKVVRKRGARILKVSEGLAEEVCVQILVEDLNDLDKEIHNQLVVKKADEYAEFFGIPAPSKDPYKEVSNYYSSYSIMMSRQQLNSSFDCSFRKNQDGDLEMTVTFPEEFPEALEVLYERFWSVFLNKVRSQRG